LVLIAGAMSTALAWRYQIDALRRDRTIIVPDQHYALRSIQAMAQDIAPRLPALFDVAGWSMGGYILFELYPLIRERVRKVAFICTSARSESPESLRKREDQLLSVAAHGIRPVYESQMDSILLDPSLLDPGFREELLTEIERLGENTLRNQVAAMVARRDSRESLREVASDALIVAGRQDIVTPVDCSIEMASLLPCATLSILEPAGHCAPWERPAEVNHLLRSFLEDP
jgi:pimeloyl-ACP methyl ester carboxylesterase